MRPPGHTHLGSEHLGVVLQDGSTEADGVRHQVDLLHRHGVLNVVHSVLEVAEELIEREGAALGVQPLVVEEDVVIQILFMALIRSVEIIYYHLP